MEIADHKRYRNMSTPMTYRIKNQKSFNLNNENTSFTFTESALSISSSVISIDIDNIIKNILQQILMQSKSLY